MYCTNCGHELKGNEKFCAGCGQPYNPAPQPQTNTTQNKNQTKPFTRILKTLLIIILAPIALAVLFFIGAIIAALTDRGSEEAETNSNPVQTPIAAIAAAAIPTIAPTTAPTATPKPSPEATPEPTPEATPEISEDEYKAMCEEYSYKEVIRNPENYVGKKIKITVKLQQKIDGGFIKTYTYYRAYDDTSGYGWYYDNEYAVYDDRVDTSLKLLLDDIIIVWGEIKEPIKVTRALTKTTDEVFSISMKYAELIGE